MSLSHSFELQIKETTCYQHLGISGRSWCYRMPCPAKGYRPTCLHCCMGGLSTLPDEDTKTSRGTSNGDKVAGGGFDVEMRACVDDAARTVAPVAVHSAFTRTDTSHWPCDFSSAMACAVAAFKWQPSRRCAYSAQVAVHDGLQPRSETPSKRVQTCWFQPVDHKEHETNA